MKLLVLSDSHGASENLTDIIRQERDSDRIIFLGDGERDFDLALAETGIDPYDPHCRKKVSQVCGNCDIFSHEPACIIEEIEGMRVYVTHGFRENVKYGLSELVRAAADRECEIALFGHTHREHLSYESGIACFNPGIVLHRSYGVVYIENGDASFELLEI